MKFLATLSDHAPGAYSAKLKFSWSEAGRNDKSNDTEITISVLFICKYLLICLYAIILLPAWLFRLLREGNIRCRNLRSQESCCRRVAGHLSALCRSLVSSL